MGGWGGGGCVQRDAYTGFKGAGPLSGFLGAKHKEGTDQGATVTRVDAEGSRTGDPHVSKQSSSQPEATA